MDVKEAIDVLQTEIKFQGYVETSMILEAHRMAIEALERTRWIPVSERLPTKEDADEFGNVRAWSSEQNWSEDAPYRWVDERGSYGYTHWMPLPEPPKEVE